MVLGFVHIRRFDEKHGYVHIEQQLPVMAGEFVGRAAGTAAAARPAERAVGTVEPRLPTSVVEQRDHAGVPPDRPWPHTRQQGGVARARLSGGVVDEFLAHAHEGGGLVIGDRQPKKVSVGSHSNSAVSTRMRGSGPCLRAAVRPAGQVFACQHHARVVDPRSMWELRPGSFTTGHRNAVGGSPIAGPVPGTRGWPGPGHGRRRW